MHLIKLISLIIVVVLLSFCSDSSIGTNQSPNAVFSVAPSTGDTSTVFYFDASLSSDPEDPKTLLYFKWDFEGNRVWTEAVDDAEANYKYTKSGNYTVSLKVIDTDGWSSETTKSIIVKDTL
ncbi:MAG: PKD domain-containing protein [Bacteroidota bacterium]